MSNANTMPTPSAPHMMTLGEIFSALVYRITQRDSDVCFIDWVIGLVFAFTFAAPVFGLITFESLLHTDALWAAVAALFVTRGNGSLVRSVREFFRAKYPGSPYGKSAN